MEKEVLTMAKPKIWTTKSYVKMPDGTQRLRSLKTWEQHKNKDGTYSFSLLAKEEFINKEELVRIDKKMMEQVGAAMSTYLNEHPEATLWDELEIKGPA